MTVSTAVRIRGWFIFALLILMLGSIVARLFYLQILQYDRYVGIAQKQSQGMLFTLPVRGKVFDRNRHPLAESIDTKSVVMMTAQVDLDSQPLRRISTALDINLSRLTPENLQGTRLTYLKRKLTPAELAEAQVLWSDETMLTSGIFLIPDTKRFYPQEKLASHILGFTGLDEQGYDNHGLEGLEFRYDDYLRGQAQAYAVPMDARRNSLNSWELDVQNTGHNLVLTIDKNIQYMVERELETTFRDEGARHATVIVMDPHTGEILALANYPDYNPNTFQNYPPQYYQNLAVTWDFEPGSTFKIIQTAAAFEEGLLSPDARLDHQGHFHPGSERPVSEWRELGYPSVEEILMKSSNVGAMMISKTLGEQRFYDYMRKFGFGELTGVDLPGEVTGKLREIKDWSDISLQSLSIGQEISVTPLQMVRAFSVIANGGVLYTPYIVKEIQDSTGTPIVQVEPRLVRRVISPKNAQLMRQILSKVVEDGTGSRAAITGYRVAGKTGTAQKFDRFTGDYSSTSLVTSFIGFVPVDYPKVVIAAIVDEPAQNEWGSTVAAPLFKRIAERVLPYLDIPPDSTVREFIAMAQEQRLVDL